MLDTIGAIAVYILVAFCGCVFASLLINLCSLFKHKAELCRLRGEHQRAINQLGDGLSCGAGTKPPE